MTGELILKMLLNVSPLVVIYFLMAVLLLSFIKIFRW